MAAPDGTPGPGRGSVAYSDTVTLKFGNVLAATLFMALGVASERRDSSNLRVGELT